MDRILTYRDKKNNAITSIHELLKMMDNMNANSNSGNSEFFSVIYKNIPEKIKNVNHIVQDVIDDLNFFESCTDTLLCDVTADEIEKLNKVFGIDDFIYLKSVLGQEKMEIYEQFDKIFIKDQEIRRRVDQSYDY